MKKKLLLTLFLVVGLAPAFVSGSNAKTTSKSKEENPYVEIYSQKGKLVKSYTNAQIKSLMKKVTNVNDFLNVQNPENRSYMHYYDQDGTGKIIDSSIEGVMELQEALIKSAAPQKLQFYQGTTFSSNVWIANQSTFYNPTDLAVYFNHSFDKVVIKLIKGEKETGSIKIGNLQGGIHVPLTDARKEAGYYKIQLVNANKYGKEIDLKGGILYHD